MRYTRDFTLPANSIYHMMWRTVAGAFFLQSNAMKRMFLYCFFRFMFRANGNVQLHSFCVMSNHSQGGPTARQRQAYVGVGSCLTLLLRPAIQPDEETPGTRGAGSAKDRRLRNPGGVEEGHVLRGLEPGGSWHV